MFEDRLPNTKFGFLLKIKMFFSDGDYGNFREV